MLIELYYAGHVTRFHTVPDYSGGHKQTVAEHSWGVALISARLWREQYGGSPSSALLEYALLHDAAERWTGDAPAPVKWQNPKLKEVLAEIEEDIERRMAIEFNLTDEELLVLKWADALELYAHARLRVRAGAKDYAVPARHIETYVLTELPALHAGRLLMDHIREETEA